MRLSDYFANKKNLTPEEMQHILVSFLNENIAAPKPDKNSWKITPEHLTYFPDGEECKTNAIKCSLSIERKDSRDEDQYDVSIDKNSLAYQYEFVHWFYHADGFSEGWDFDVSGGRDFTIELNADEKRFIEAMMLSYDTPEQIQKYDAEKLKTQLYRQKDEAQKNGDIQEFFRIGAKLASRFPKYSFPSDFNLLLIDCSKFMKNSKDIPDGSKKGLIYTEDATGKWSLYKTVKTPTTLKDGTKGILQNDRFELLASGEDALYGKECLFRCEYKNNEFELKHIENKDDSVKERFVPALESQIIPIVRIENMSPVHDGSILISAPEVILPHLYIDNVEITNDPAETADLSEENIEELSDDEWKAYLLNYIKDAVTAGEVALEIALDDEKDIHAYVIGDGNRFLYPENETEEVSLTQTEKEFLRSLFGEELEAAKDAIAEELD